MKYPTMEKAKKLEKEKYGHLEPGWNENPSNAMHYPSLQSETTKAAIEAQEALEYGERVEAYNNGEAPISVIMYPSMKYKPSKEVKPGENIDRSSAWVEKHGSIDGFKEYMAGLKSGLNID